MIEQKICTIKSFEAPHLTFFTVQFRVIYWFFFWIGVYFCTHVVQLFISCAAVLLLTVYFLYKIIVLSNESKKKEKKMVAKRTTISPRAYKTPRHTCMTLKTLVLAGNRHKNMAVLYWLMRSQHSSLETWISYGNTYINKLIRNVHRLHSNHTFLWSMTLHKKMIG